MFSYANCGDDENSQAEGLSEGAVGFSRSTTGDNNNNSNIPANPHYENIYETIDQYAVAAPAAENVHQIAQIINLPNGNPRILNNNQNFNNQAYRNELYDRTSGYDVPRTVRNNTVRRANLHLDLNSKRPRYSNNVRPSVRQRSFDDTESYHYNNCVRYENIYEHIREEPIYRNTTNGNGNRVYGRVGVIGHGIGRIERHLSSSCGNIDHYNLGGHYAVLGHSHLGTVGHIRLNATNNGQPSSREINEKENNGHSYFSCLGGENSQSMNNIYRATNGQAAGGSASNNVPPVQNPQPSTSRTGAIPKYKTKTPPKEDSSPEHTRTLNRVSKSSLQWLLVNKWLPLWVGQAPDYKMIDFNFMFSRNCEGCGDNIENRQELVRFNGQAEMRNNVNCSSKSECGTSGNSNCGKPLKNNQALTRLRECEYGRDTASSSQANRMSYSQSLGRSNHPNDMRRTRDVSKPSTSLRCQKKRSDNPDPFRNWELNTANNSFRPAGGRIREIRRITDGTFRIKNMRKSNNEKINPVEPIPSTSTINRIPEQSIASVSVSPQDVSDGTSDTTKNDETTYYQNSECTEDDQDEVQLSELDDD